MKLSNPLFAPKRLNQGVQACAGKTTHCPSASSTSSTSSGAVARSVGRPSLDRFPYFANRSPTASADSIEGASKQWCILRDLSPNENVVLTSPVIIYWTWNVPSLSRYNPESEISWRDRKSTRLNSSHVRI